jgi:prevent-host-death family protein
MPSHWQLQDAKAHLSALVKQAETKGPQHISVHGKPAAVVLSEADFRSLQARSSRPSFTQLMRESPWVGLVLDTSRLQDETRPVSFED